MKFVSLLLLFPSLCFAGDWSIEDTYRQSALTALLIADWSQTRWAMKHPEKFTELNTILGDHPSMGRLNNYATAEIVGHAAISYMLPPEWRKGWQYVWIGVETHAVYRNHKVGVKFSF